MSTASIEHDEPSRQDPPQNVEAEQSVLGGMMLAKEVIPDVVEMVAVEHFYRPAHQTIYECICDLYLRGEPADVITVAGELQNRRELVRVGGAPYLHTLLATVPIATNATYYAEQILDAADLRNIAEVGTALAAYASAPGSNAAALLERAQDRITEAVDFRVRSGADGALLGPLMATALEDLETIQAGESKGLSTGFGDLDALTTGFHPGQMITLAARPGLGKSALSADFARHAAIKNGVGTLIFNLEMSRSEMVMRLLSAEAKVRLTDMRSGRMSEDDWTRVARCMADLDDVPLVIDDTAKLTPVDMAARSRKWQRRFEARGIELGLIVVDYLQLMTTSGRAESRQQEVSDISRNIKLLGKELGVPIVALSQLNRKAEERPDKKPQISDLRESGSLEQDSDMVILIHRPDAFDRDDPRMGEADLILAKNRSGPTGTITVAHQLHYSRFVDMAQE